MSLVPCQSVDELSILGNTNGLIKYCWGGTTVVSRKNTLDSYIEGGDGRILLIRKNISKIWVAKGENI